MPRTLAVLSIVFITLLPIAALAVDFRLGGGLSDGRFTGRHADWRHLSDPLGAHVDVAVQHRLAHTLVDVRFEAMANWIQVDALFEPTASRSTETEVAFVGGPAFVFNARPGSLNPYIVVGVAGYLALFDRSPSAVGWPPHGSTWYGGTLLELGAGLDLNFETFALFGEARWYAQKADWSSVAAETRTITIGVRF